MEGATAYSKLLAAAERAAEIFNGWMSGDMEMSVEGLEDGEVKLLISQKCSCSLDYSLKEEVENAFREAGIEVEARIEGWDVERGSYRASVRPLKAFLNVSRGRE